MDSELLYEERLRSSKTGALFLVLAALLGSLYARRALSGNRRGLATVGFGLGAVFFAFCAVNYRTLVIRLTRSALTLTFGLFRWEVPLENVGSCTLDDVPLVMRLGGAGIHFMLVRQRYRVSFNFLVYPRLVIGFRRRLGPVRDISFSTRQPEQLGKLIRATAAGMQSHPS